MSIGTEFAGSFDTYKGESVGKKLSRLMLWAIAREHMTEDVWQRGPHLVLSSREAGDVSVLLGLGAPPASIVAIDRNEAAVIAARLKFPHVRIEHSTIQAFTERCRRNGTRLASAFLDFCAPLSRPIVSDVAHTLDCMSDRGFYGVGILRGREQGLFRAALSGQETAFARFLSSSVPLSPGSDYDDLIRYWDRDMLCVEALIKQERCVARGWMPAVSLGEHHYQSTTSSGRGVPMMYFTGILARRWPGEARNHFLRRVHEDMGNCTEALQALGLPIDYSQRAPHVSRDQSDAILRDMVLKVRETGRYAWTGSNGLPHHIHVDAESQKQAHLLLNVSESTLRAWKAHATRGTYASGAALEGMK